MIARGRATPLASSLARSSARLEGTATYTMRTYTGPSVLVIDELSDRTPDQTSATWIFQMVSRCYEADACADLGPWLRGSGPDRR